MAKRFTYGVNIAPLIDVVFILLAFMFLYSRLDTAESIEVALPQAEGEAAEAASPAVLSITKDGAFFWGREALTEEELKQRILSLGKSSPLIVQTDREAPAEGLVKVMSMLAKAGIEAASIKVALPDRQGEPRQSARASQALVPPLPFQRKHPHRF